MHLLRNLSFVTESPPPLLPIPSFFPTPLLRSRLPSLPPGARTNHNSGLLLLLLSLFSSRDDSSVLVASSRRYYSDGVNHLAFLFGLLPLCLEE